MTLVVFSDARVWFSWRLTPPWRAKNWNCPRSWTSTRRSPTIAATPCTTYPRESWSQPRSTNCSVQRVMTRMRWRKTRPRNLWWMEPVQAHTEIELLSFFPCPHHTRVPFTFFFFQVQYEVFCVDFIRDKRTMQASYRIESKNFFKWGKQKCNDLANCVS